MGKEKGKGDEEEDNGLMKRKTKKGIKDPLKKSVKRLSWKNGVGGGVVAQFTGKTSGEGTRCRRDLC